MSANADLPFSPPPQLRPGYGRTIGATAAVATVATVTIGVADGTFLVSANVLITVATSFSFSVACTYTDDGNTARSATLPTYSIGGALVTTFGNAGGTVPYMGSPIQIRVKAGTTITILTSGTFTTVTYNVEGTIVQLA